MGRKLVRTPPDGNVRGPSKPSAALLSLARFEGSWRLSGPKMTGAVTFEWFDGGFFLVQRGWVKVRGREVHFVEYIGYDEARKACMSRLFDNFGDRFAYEWEVDGDDICISFGQKGSGNSFTGKFSADGDSFSGAWKWPGGGYSTVAKKVPRSS
jgi:hypothetical protein